MQGTNVCLYVQARMSLRMFSKTKRWKVKSCLVSVPFGYKVQAHYLCSHVLISEYNFNAVCVCLGKCVCDCDRFVH